MHNTLGVRGMLSMALFLQPATLYSRTAPAPVGLSVQFANGTRPPATNNGVRSTAPPRHVSDCAVIPVVPLLM